MTKRCFVIMPFSTTTKKHTEEYWTNFFTQFIKPSVEKYGYSCIRSQAQPSNIINEIITELLDAGLVLAVLTDFNANVWYELGIRHARRRGTIMIIEATQKLSFDISHYGVIRYQDNIAGTQNFGEELEKFIEKLETTQSPDNPVLEYMSLMTEKEYQQSLKEMETRYNTKLESIAKTILGEIQKGRNKDFDLSDRKGKSVLWVDDYPSNNEYIIDLYRVLGVEFDLAINTDQAIDFLSKKKYDLIISDMGRGDEPDAGLKMLREIKKHLSIMPPIVFFASPSALSKFGNSVLKEGAILTTSYVGQLVELIEKMLYS